MSTVVVTIHRGRHRHLLRQIDALARSEESPAAHVVVSMDDAPPRLAGCDVLALEADPRALPLAAARNAGIERAAGEHGASLVVCLDVDCLPSPDLIGRYERAASKRPRALLSGAVYYLPAGVPAEGSLPSPGELAGLTPHPARPAPPAGALLEERRAELFWSLSFAVSPEVHRAIGGFDEGYVGYGGEDTDYGLRAAGAGIPLTWVGGCDAYHQHHPVSSPPVEHLDDIVRNARRFHARWGRWPMQGWLAAFAARGLITWTPDGAAVSRVGSSTREFISKVAQA